MRWLDSVTSWMDMNFSKLREIVKDREAWRAAVHGVTKSQTWLSDWTTEGRLEIQILYKLILEWKAQSLKVTTKIPLLMTSKGAVSA